MKMDLFKDSNSEWKFYTFRCQWDLDQIKEKGEFTVKENLSGTLIYEIGKYFLKSDSVIYGMCTKDKLSHQGYLGHDRLVHFKPNKYLKFTVERYEHINNGFARLLSLLENDNEFSDQEIFENYLCLNEQYLEFCKNEVSPSGIYFILFPNLTEDMIIDVKEIVQEKESSIGEAVKVQAPPVKRYKFRDIVY